MTYKPTRRRLLASLPALALNLRAQAQFSLFGSQKAKQHPAPLPLVYFGTSKGIFVARFDAAAGHLTEPMPVAESIHASFFAFGPEHNGRRMFYAGSEGSKVAPALLYALVPDPATGMLKQLGGVPTGAGGPCYVAVDVTGQAVFAADYSGGAVSSFRVLADGTLSQPVDVIRFNDRERYGAPGPIKDRQNAAHPHSTMISPDNRFVVVNDLGTDRIWIFPFEPATAHLGEPSFFELQPGSGPRHVAFHPNGRWVYGIDELASRIDQYLWTATRGAQAKALLVDTGHSISTLAPGYSGPTNTAAEITVSNDGHFLYASNRGEETLVVFAIHPETGAPALIQRIGCGGKMPRHFTFDPAGRWLLCGNQGSGSVAVFARDQASGKLAGPVQTTPLASVLFTLFDQDCPAGWVRYMRGDHFVVGAYFGRTAHSPIPHEVPPARR